MRFLSGFVNRKTAFPIVENDLNVFCLTEMFKIFLVKLWHLSAILKVDTKGKRIRLKTPAFVTKLPLFISACRLLAVYRSCSFLNSKSTTLDWNTTTLDWNTTTLDWNTTTVNWNTTTVNWNTTTVNWNTTTVNKNTTTLNWNPTTVNWNKIK